MRNKLKAYVQLTIMAVVVFALTMTVLLGAAHMCQLQQEATANTIQQSSK